MTSNLPDAGYYYWRCQLLSARWTTHFMQLLILFFSNYCLYFLCLDYRFHHWLLFVRFLFLACNWTGCQDVVFFALFILLGFYAPIGPVANHGIFIQSEFACGYPFLLINAARECCSTKIHCLEWLSIVASFPRQDCN